jgi:hypothetical protein
MSYDPLSDDTKLKDAIISVFQKLRDEFGSGVTLEQVTDAFNTTYGLNYTKLQVAKYLAENLQSKRQGVSSTTTQAGVLSDNAAQVSAEANEKGDTTSHARAAVAHSDASRAHKAAHRYHDRAESWHMQKAEGMDPEPLEAD